MTGILLLAFIIMVAGIIAVPIATRTGLGSVLGYLVAGIILGPLLTLLNVDVVGVQHIAEFGVVMMLFLVGLELNPKLLWNMRARLLGLGGGQLLLTTVGVSAVAFAFDMPWRMSIAIGVVLALSSTAIVLQTLDEKGLMKGDGGQASFSVLLFQDIAVIPILTLLPLLASPELAATVAEAAGGGHDSGHGVSLVAHLNTWQTTLVTIAAVAVVVFGGSFLTQFVFRFIAVAQLRELFTAAALAIVVGIALLMSLVGLSPALGTFLAGVVLANSEYKHELESSIDPFKGLLLGLFFITVGAGINFDLLTANFGQILGLTLGLIGIKAVVLLVLAKVFKLARGDGWLLALGLSQAGEFGFVLLSFVVGNHILPAEIADRLLLIVALSMLLTPGLFIIYDKVVSPRFAKAQEREADAIHEQNQVIIAGRGRIGGIIDRILKGAGIQSTVIDYSSRQLEMLAMFGVKTYFGDATRPDLLHAAGIKQAKILVISIDGKEQITEMVKHVAKTYPHVHIVARAVDRTHVYQLWYHGCRDIIRETYDSSIRMGRSVFEAMGLERDKAQAMVNAFEDMDRKAMQEVASSFDVNVPIEENKEFIEHVRSKIDAWEKELQKTMSDIKAGKV